MRWLILGSVEVSQEGRVAPIQRPQERGVLAYLLLNANRVVATERLVDAMWGNAAPATARTQLQVCVSRIRKALPDDRVLVTCGGGYKLVVTDGSLDLAEFAGTVDRAQAAARGGDPVTAAALLRSALEVWRGPALAGASGAFVAAAATSLEERRLGAVEALADIELGLCRHRSLVAELSAHVDAYPLRERLVGQLMIALTGSGQQAQALELFTATRARLVDALGIEPSPELTDIRLRILRQGVRVDGPAAVAGPAAADGPPRQVPRELPADTVGFTGRTAEILALDRRSASTGIVLVTGTAGVGKTALAVRWAHQVSARFPDGQLYLNLQGYSTTVPIQPIQALSRLLRSLGVAAEQIPLDVDEAAALYRSLLAGRRALIMLDNARTASQVRPLLPGSAGCRVVVTSRDRLGGLVVREGAQPITLQVLGAAEARLLLERTIGVDRARAETGAVEELATVCAFLPLALRISGANAGSHPLRPIADQVTRLREDKSLAALAVDGDEESSVVAAFDVSYEAIPAAARRLFRLLGLLPGDDLTAPAAAAAAGVAPGEAAGLLERLASAHLLHEHLPGRFRFHDLLRRYARARSCDEDTEADREATLDRFFAWCLHGVSAAADRLYPQRLRLARLPADGIPPAPDFADHVQARRWLDTERQNLVAAVQHAATAGPRPVAWRLVDGLRGYFWLGSHCVDWLVANQAAWLAAEAEGSAEARAAIHASFGDLRWRQSQFAQAAGHYTRALLAARQARWVEGQASSLANLGAMHMELGRLRRATACQGRALRLHRETGRLVGQAGCLSNLGTTSVDMGRFRRAAVYYEEALALFQKLGSRVSEAMTRANLGEVWVALGDLDRAQRQAAEAVAAAADFGDLNTEAEAQRVLAMIERDRGRHATAVHFAEQSLAAGRAIAEPRVEVEALNVLGSIYVATGEHREAYSHYQLNHEIACRIGTTNRTVAATIGMAVAQHGLGNATAALEHASSALASARRLDFGFHAAEALTVLAGVYRDLGQPERAARAARSAVDLHRRTHHLLGTVRALRAVARAVPDTSEAKQCLHRARDLQAGLGEERGPREHRVAVDDTD